MGKPYKTLLEDLEKPLYFLKIGTILNARMGIDMFFSSKQIERIIREDKNRIIVDVRTKDEYASGHIPGAICIPNETISNIDPVQLSNKDQNIIVYCQTGMRASKAAKKLKRLGYKNVFNFGGINSWRGDIER